MANRPLTREEADFIRAHIKEGVDLGETERQIQARRIEVAHMIGCTLKQAAAASAWKYEGESLVLKPQEFLESKEKGEDVQVHKAPTHVDEPPHNSEELVSHVKVHPKSGAWADYEGSHIKELWRQAEMSFLDRHMEMLPKKPEDMRVLCTPGIKCHLEIRHLLERGFNPKNIIAVEREKAAWGDFERACGEIGVQPQYGDLKEVLKNTKEPFDVVMLDFLGSYCLSYQEVIYNLPLAKRAFVALNMAGKRERKPLQEAMQRTIDVVNNVLPNLIQERMSQRLEKARTYATAEDLTPSQAWSHNQSALQNAYNDVHNELTSREIEMTDEHRDAVMHSLLQECGIARPDNWTYPNSTGKFPIIFSKERLLEARKELPSEDFLRAKSIHSGLTHFELGIFGQFRMQRLDSDPVARPLSKKIGPFVAMAGQAITGNKKIAALERYKYMSQMGKTPSPYLTDLAIVDWPYDAYRKQLQSISFGLNCASRTVESAIKKLGLLFPIGIENYKLIVKVLEKKKESHVGTIALRTLIDDIEIFEKLEKDYPLSSYNYRSKPSDRKMLKE